MFLIWGSGSGSAAAGDAGMRHCPVCNEQRRFDIVVNYFYRHFWYLLSWVSKREHVLVCSQCDNALADEKLSRQEIAEKLSGKKDPVPFIRRRGWLLCIALVVALLGFGAYQSDQDSKELAQRIAAPKVGDIYLADISKISDGFGKSPIYGAMKLVSIEEDGKLLNFIVANQGYSKKKGVRKDASKGLLKQDSYYDTEDIIELSPEKLADLDTRGVIYKAVK